MITVVGVGPSMPSFGLPGKYRQAIEPGLTAAVIETGGPADPITVSTFQHCQLLLDLFPWRQWGLD